MQATSPPPSHPDLRLPVRIGTRRSRLALWQANWVRDELRRQWGAQLPVELVEIVTGAQALD